MSSCFSRCLRVPIAMRTFYEPSLWILQHFLLTHLDLHHRLIGDGWSTPSGVHNCRQFLDRALAPEVMFPSPQWLKPSHCRILTAPLKRCSTLYTKCENALAPAPAKQDPSGAKAQVLC